MTRRHEGFPEHEIDLFVSESCVRAYELVVQPKEGRYQTGLVKVPKENSEEHGVSDPQCLHTGKIREKVVGRRKGRGLTQKERRILVGRYDERKL